MFLNTLQLMSHLPLIKSQMPAPANYFMSQFLDLSRFNVVWPLLKDFAIQNSYYKEGALNMTFEAYGYASMYIWGNTPSLIILAFVIFAFWGLSFLKDIFVNSTNRVCVGWIRDRFMLNKHSAWMTNFALRFWYEAFIFVCISVLISLNKSEQENVVPELNEKHDPESEHAQIDKIVASILLSMILATLIFALWQVMAEYFLTKYSHVKKYCLDIKQSAEAKADARADLKNALRMEDS